MITLPNLNNEEFKEKVEDNLNIIMSSIEAHRKIFVNIDKRLEALEKKVNQLDSQDDIDRGAFKSVE